MNFLIGDVKISISFNTGVFVEWDTGYFELSAPVFFTICVIAWFVVIGFLVGV